MAHVEFTPSTVSLTTTTHVIEDDFGLGLPPWDISGLSQVLLPALCALFITVVIIVIACCLIQKKSKSSGVLRQKSSHTIETLHEVSDHDIYDVIDELRVKNLSPDKFHSRHGKIDYNGLLASHRHSPHSKLGNAFTSKSAAISCQCASKIDILASRVPVRDPRDCVGANTESLSNNARLSTNTEGGASNVSNDDDGIYETLDRHWTLKTEQKVSHPAANCQGGCNDDGRKHSPPDVHLNINEIAETSSSQSSRSSQEIQPPSEDVSAPYGEARKLVCQISMFEFNNEESKPALIETTYYQIQPQIYQIPGSHGANIPELLQKTSLRIVQDSMQETNQSGNLLLKPLKEDEVLLHQLSQSLVRKNSQLMKTTKIYEKLQKSGSKRVPTLLVKKSESFRTATSELHAAKERNRLSRRRKSDSSDIEAPQLNARSPTRHAHISAGPEATRILTKLGPLPPVPAPCQGVNQKTDSGHAGDKSEESTFQNNAVKVHPSMRQDLSLNIDSENGNQPASIENTEIVLRYPAVHVPSGNCDLRPTDPVEFMAQSKMSCRREINMGVKSEKCEFRDSKLLSGMEVESACRDDVSTESVCRVKVDRVYDSSSSSPDGEESNYYFVLEPRDGTSRSSRNSDLASSSDCCDMGWTPDMEIQQLAGDRSSRCSVEVPTHQ